MTANNLITFVIFMFVMGLHRVSVLHFGIEMVIECDQLALLLVFVFMLD
jgi:hypothetical protein